MLFLRSPLRVNQYKQSLRKHDADVKCNHVYKEVRNCLRFYVFHLHKSGRRLGNSEESTDSTDDMKTEKKTETSSLDPSFSRVINSLEPSTDNTNRFKRLGGNEHDISAVSNTVEDENEEDEESTNVAADNGYDTFSDEMYQSLSVNRQESFSKILKLIQSEGYDTESLGIDLEMCMDDGVSNLSQLIEPADKDSCDLNIIDAMWGAFDKSSSYVLICTLCYPFPYMVLYHTN